MEEKNEVIEQVTDQELEEVSGGFGTPKKTDIFRNSIECPYCHQQTARGQNFCNRCKRAFR